MLSHYPSKPTHEDDRKRQRSLAQPKIYSIYNSSSTSFGFLDKSLIKIPKRVGVGE